ncbi:MAG: FkbM family methyltransferase [Chloroflexi bacterium]|nr:FkbM family methyltransferase [Chloroflexota bacterium]
MKKSPVHAALEAFRTTPTFAVNRRVWGLRRALAPWIRLPCTVRGPDGALFPLGADPIDDLILEGVYGRFADLYLPNALALEQPEFLVMDAGAHHGFAAIALLKRHPLAQVIAVEPSPRSAAVLRRNLAINGLTARAEVVEAAIGSESGNVALDESAGASWSTHTVSSGTEASLLPQVPAMRVLTILRGRRPVFVKCNAEGGEYALFPELFAAGVFPNSVALFAHPDEGDMEGLLAAFRRHEYDVRPTAWTEKRPRYLCVRKTL